MRFILVCAAILAGILSSLLFLEITFRILPEQGSFGWRKEVTDYPGSVYEPNRSGSNYLGWDFRGGSFTKTNAQGFHDLVDHVQGPTDLVTVGDSYADSIMIKTENRFQNLIANELGLTKSYTVAAPGYSLADDIIAAEWAVQKYQPNLLFILVVDHDVNASFEASDGYHKYRPENGGKIVKVPAEKGSSSLKKLTASRLAQYSLTNLKLTPSGVIDLVRSDFKLSKKSGKPELPAQLLTANSYFANRLEKLQRAMKGRLVVIFDGDRRSIKLGKTEAAYTDPLSDLEEILRHRNISTINLHQIFLNDWQKNRLPIDFAPTDLHWNDRGHRLAADHILESLRTSSN